METIKKKCFYTATYHLPSDSVLKTYIIKDHVIDEDGLINIFENDEYKVLLLVANDTDIKISQFIYKSVEELIFTEVDPNKINENGGKLDDQINTFFCKSEQENYKNFNIDTKGIDRISLREIEKCVNRLYLAFCSLRSLANQTKTINVNKQKAYINIYDYDSKIKFFPVETIVASDSSSGWASHNPTLSCRKIISVLKVIKDNIDEYIRRFLVLEKLSSDPVLTLITLFALYEYIKENNPSDKSLERTLQKDKKAGYNANLEEKFRNTRHLVAHGFAGGKGKKSKENTTKILEEFLGYSPSGIYSFDRDNPSHMKLVSEVISEVQPVIHNYLREELGLK
jgi:hypothetical protein